MFQASQRVRMVQNRPGVPEPPTGTKGTVVSCEAPYTVVFVKWDDGALPPVYLEYGDRIERLPWWMNGFDHILSYLSAGWRHVRPERTVPK